MGYPRFLYYLLKPDGRSGKVVNGVVTYTGTPTPLPQTPNGWQELQLAFERSMDKHGLVTSASLNFGFVKHGAHITRDGLYRETTENNIQLLIQRLTLELTVSTYKWYYDYFFKGDLDLPKTEDKQDMIEVPITQGGLSKFLKANEKTNYEFPMSDPDCVWLKHDGITKEYLKKYILQEDQEVTGIDNFFLGMFGSSAEGVSPNVVFFDVPFQVSTPYPNDDYFIQVIASQLIRVHGTITVYFNTESGFTLRLETNDDGFPQYDLVNISATPRDAGLSETFEFDETITLAALDKMNIKLFGGDPGSGDVQFTVTSGEVNIEYDFRAAATYFKCYPRPILYKRIIGKVTGDEANAISQLCTDFDAILITCADAIRGFDTATLKTNLEDFYDDTDATLMAGMAVTPNGIEIEDRKKYYSEDEIYPLGVIKDFVKKPADEFKAHTFKFGHAKQDIENINGKYDPNGNNQYEGPLLKSGKEYNKVSPYKAGPYEIEDIRINLEGLLTTDDNRDNDIYVIAAVANPDLTTIVGFSSALNGMLISSSEGFFIGQQILITGSVSNDGVYDITGFGSILVSQLIIFSQPVIDEVNANVTISWQRGRVYTLDRPAYTVLEGVPNDSIYNLPFLTPKTMLKRHGPWLVSMNAGLENKKITFTSGKDNKNTDPITDDVNEKADEAISGLGGKMFLPWIFTFKGPVAKDIPERIEANPNMCFSFTDERGNDWVGFNLVTGIAINEYTPQEFRLLAAPSNDILKLIHG